MDKYTVGSRILQRASAAQHRNLIESDAHHLGRCPEDMCDAVLPIYLIAESDVEGRSPGWVSSLFAKTFCPLLENSRPIRLREQEKGPREHDSGNYATKLVS